MLLRKMIPRRAVKRKSNTKFMIVVNVHFFEIYSILTFNNLMNIYL